MGSQESRLPLRRDHHLQRPSASNSSSSSNVCGYWGTRNRSRFARLVLCKKINFLQLICTLAVFFFFLFLFQMFLPGFVMDDVSRLDETHNLYRKKGEGSFENLSFLKELDFGEDIKFEPLNIFAKFQRDAKEVNESVASRKVIRFGYSNPKLALVFADLLVDPHQILMVTVATALREIGYEIEVFSLEVGCVHAIWRDLGFPISVITADDNMKFSIDWLNYNGILVNSLKAVGILYSLMQETFKSVPLVWTVHEHTLAERLRLYVSSGQTELVDDWRKVFSQATVIVFPNYYLPILYSASDPGNYLVIPGSPAEAWKANKLMASYKDNLPLKINYGLDDFVIAVVGSRLMYRGLWVDHALVLQALYPLLPDFDSSSSHLKIIILAGDHRSNYSRAVETIALNLEYPNETVKHVAADEDADTVLGDADLVIYGSFLEEHIFPDVLLKAMCLGKPIIAPDLPMTRKYVSDRANGYLFPIDDIGALTKIMFQLVSNGKLSLSSRNGASIGKHSAKNLMVSETVEGYALLLENILMLPSEVAVPQTAKEIPPKLKDKWQWHHFDAIKDDAGSPNITGRIHRVVDKVEKQFNHIHKDNYMALGAINDSFPYSIWEEQKSIDMANIRKRREDEELKDRTDQSWGTWDEIYRNARRLDRSLHERDEGELERTGQPLCIYEPYLGEGAWSFLHHTSLYRGIGMSTKGRRPEADDVDAPSHLPLLNNAYYRDVLGEYGAFFVIANRIDRKHKNAWIGFQSWRATARMKSLLKAAERSLLGAIEARKHGDALYFWASSDKDPRNPLQQDFWSFCDAINAGNCRFAFSEALKRMYGIKHNSSSLPPMPLAKGTWSVMHCWALPTKSFMEFVMFSRMYVDALDVQFYDDHQKTGRCYLSLSKDKQCYSRLLELLVNVWAYHSARRMVYVNPETGSMQEQHKLNSRRGLMWVKWFQLSTLKSMDEELAEEFDSDHPKRRWLWPSTGEVFWQGIYEKERNLRNKEKERKKQLSREKIRRMRKRAHQKALGKYVKPAEAEPSNSISPEARLLR